MGLRVYHCEANRNLNADFLFKRKKILLFPFVTHLVSKVQCKNPVVSILPVDDSTRTIGRGNK